MSKNVTITEAILQAAAQLAITVSIKEVMSSVGTTSKHEFADLKDLYRERVAHALPGLTEETIEAVTDKVAQIILAASKQQD